MIRYLQILEYEYIQVGDQHLNRDLSNIIIRHIARIVYEDMLICKSKYLTMCYLTLNSVVFNDKPDHSTNLYTSRCRYIGTYILSRFANVTLSRWAIRLVLEYDETLSIICLQISHMLLLSIDIIDNSDL